MLFYCKIPRYASRLEVGWLKKKKDKFKLFFGGGGDVLIVSVDAQPISCHLCHLI